LLNISIYEFDTRRHLTGITLADSASIVGENRWELHAVKQTLFTEQGASVNNQAHFEWNTAISPNIFNVLLMLPEKMSAYDLWQYSHHLTENHQKPVVMKLLCGIKLYIRLRCGLCCCWRCRLLLCIVDRVALAVRSLLVLRWVYVFTSLAGCFRA